MRFSALVLTLDEARHIDACLRSLAAADRIVVLDSGSRDGTCAIASSHRGVTVLTRDFESFSDQRNFGLAHCFAAGEWVLHLDADERLTPELREEILALTPAGDALAYNLAPRTFLDGRPVLRASGYPVYQTRLTRAGFFEYEEVGHGQKAPARYGTLPSLRNPYDHHPFEKGFEEWYQRHLRYADKEALEALRGGRLAPPWGSISDPIRRRLWLNRATSRLRLRAWLVWAYLMFIRLGVLDGPAGWEYCRRRRIYEKMISERIDAATHRGTLNPGRPIG
jgi:glycosyltransferase involved in cell wall biosynthesis